MSMNKNNEPFLERKNSLIAFAVLVIALAFSACKKEFYNDTLDYQYDYQPLEIGQYTIFDVDSYRYVYTSPSQFVDTVRYQQRELISDTFYDNQNRLNYRLEMMRRPNAAASWGDLRVWYCVKTATNFERIEDDLRFTKFVFPPKDGISWKGNTYLPTTDTNFFKVYNDWNYIFKDVNTPKTIQTLSFDSTATIVQVDEENLIDKKRSVEVFAKGVGLVSKEFEVIEKQDVTSSWDRPLKANGFRIRMKVNSYGK
jgi:hypothetical protein